MSRAGTVSLWAGAGALLIAPFFTAFRSGGYGIKSQLLVGAVLFVLLAVAALTVEWPLWPGGAPLAALAGLFGLTVWVTLSVGWARIEELAAHDVYRLSAYSAALGLALVTMRVRAIRRIAPVVLLTGILVVSLYALAGRFLPHLVHEESTTVRLNQPFRYWNSLGLFTGFGVLIGVALAGERTRSRALRAACCAAAVPCGLACVLTL
ncbi:MAG: hypothetical protein ACJ760_13690, partial [Thermoleophilaceae bacterium]